MLLSGRRPGLATAAVRRWTSSSLPAALVLAALLATGCGGSDDATVPSGQEVQAALDEAVDAGAPGIAVAIRGADGEEFLTSGVAAIESKQPIRPDTRFRIASVTKSFTATIVMQLVAERKLSLDDTVKDLAPGLLAAGGQITVRQLLGHTSGLPDYVKSDAFVKRAGAGKSLTPQQALGFVADEEPEFEPGSKYAYSDSDNIALGLIIEKVTGNSYEQELRTRILEPLGLDQTNLATSLRFPKPHAQGYQYSEGGSGEPENVTDIPLDPNGAWASGALISTPREVSRFFGALLDGDLVPEEQLKEMMVTVPGAGSPPGPGTNNAGLGIFGWEISCGKIWGHTGSWPGFRTLAAASGDGNSAVAMVVNATNTSGETNKAILRAQELAACRALGEPNA
jgi:D-alanyl-D-alanine carboxypeptidase